MYFHSFVLSAFVLWSCSVLAVATRNGIVPRTAGKGSFKLPAGRRTNGHPSLQRRQNGTCGTVQATYFENDWQIPVSIGGQTIDLTMDTGSTNLWFKSTLQPLDQQSSDPILDLSKTTGWNPINGQITNNSYMGGTIVQADVGRASVTVGNLTAINMQISAATNVSGWEGSGIIGFSFLSASTDGTPSFFESIMATLEQPIFATNFKDDNTGHVDFGAINQTAFTAPLTKALLTSPISWIVPGVFAGMDGKVNSSGLDFLFDTGTSQTLIDSNSVKTYYGKVPGAIPPASNASAFTPWTYPCNTTLPDLTLFFSNTSSGPNLVTIPGSRFSSVFAGSQGNCTSLLMSGDNAGYYSAGDAFFLSNYVIFNRQEPSISFAPQVSDAGR